MKVGDTVRINEDYGGRIFRGRTGIILRPDNDLFGFDWVVAIDFSEHGQPALQASFREYEITVSTEENENRNAASTD